MTLTITAGILAAFLIVYIVFRTQSHHGNESYEMGRKEFEHVKDSNAGIFIDGHDYHFFTTGHPYYWVEVTFSEFEKKFIEGCVQKEAFYSYPIKISYSLKIDIERKSIYFVPKIENYDFHKLKHPPL